MGRKQQQRQPCSGDRSIIRATAGTAAQLKSQVMKGGRASGCLLAEEEAAWPAEGMARAGTG